MKKVKMNNNNKEIAKIFTELAQKGINVYMTPEGSEKLYQIFNSTHSYPVVASKEEVTA